MFKLYLSLLIIFIVACNNNTDKSTTDTDSAKATTATTKSFTWSNEDEKEFLGDLIIDNSQALEMANIYTNILSSTRPC